MSEMTTDVQRQPRVYFGPRSGWAFVEEVRKGGADVERMLSRHRLSFVDPVVSFGTAPPPISRARAIVEFDLALLRSCDAVLVDMSLPIGTILDV